MPRTRRKPNRRNLLLVLAGVSLLGLLMPASVTSRFMNLVQVILPFQDWTTRGAQAAEEAIEPAEPAISVADADRLQRENAALRHRLASLSAGYDELEREHHSLASIRGRGLTVGKLIPARTVAEDALSWRESRLINSGTLSGVQRSAPVASNHFSISSNADEAVSDGMAVLAGEVLVGFVEQAGTHASRVVLLTDRTTEMRVLIARLEEGVYRPLDAEFWLVGTGSDLLEIHDVDHRYVTTEAISVGDTVLTSPSDPRLPAPMTIGVISAIRQDQGNRLLYTIDVRPPLDAKSIRKVFVVDVRNARR